jgi:replicative DNA helicase
VTTRQTVPNDFDAEQGVLGGILLRTDALGLLTLEVDDFYDPRHKQIFGAMRNLEAALRPIDTVTIGDELDRKDGQNGHGGTPLADLCVPAMAAAVLRVPTADRVEEYARIVREHRVTRDLMLALDDVVARCREGEIRGDEAVSMAAATLGKLDSGKAGLGKAMGQICREEFGAIMRDVDARENDRPVQIGVPTSLAKLDAHLGGIPVGIVTILAGRPGHGKTTLAQTLWRAAAALTPDEPVLYTYEDGEQSFAQREIAAQTGVPTQNIRAREFTRGDIGKIQNRSAEVKALRGVLVEAHGLSIDALVRDVRRRRLKARAEGRSSCGLVVVDYLQRMPLPEGWGRADEKIGWILDKLVTLAATERIAVVVCSQLNREIEKRDDKRPRLVDMRESGKIEELCKVALGVYRPAKYEPNADPNALEILVLKNHQGEADVKAEVFWHMPTHTIVDSRVDLRRAG